MSTVALTNGLADADLLLASVRAQLARPRGERPSEPAALDDRLGQLGERLRAAVPAAAPATAAAVLELVYETTELRDQLRERELSERLEVLARIRESMEQLRECESPEELIEAAPGELCRACGFSRVLISRIRGGKWVPVLIDAVPGRDPEEDVFKAWVEQAEIPLTHMLIETELVRRRMPAFISDPVNDRRAPREIVTRGRTVAYVATPIISDGRAIGFLHADRIGQREQVTAEDRDTIWMFAEQFGLIYQRAVLVERLAAQRTQLHEAFVAAESVVDELRESELKLARTPHRAAAVASAGALFRPEESRLAALLTRRELEVMELITSGATNVRIGEQLVISEGTVKSHVKHILRKLHVNNRSEAVARYLQLVKRDQEQSGR
ncbi:MAG: LuxR C-terminal-related transcriptional regulator [Solirubrobacteraceae bacterium]